MTTNQPVWSFVLCALAVWRITHLLAEEDGPWELIVRLRKRVGNGFLGRLLDCFYCLSLWISLPPALWLGGSWDLRMICWLALSGAACLLERTTAKPETPVHPIEFFEGETLCAAVKSETR